MKRSKMKTSRTLLPGCWVEITDDAKSNGLEEKSDYGIYVGKSKGLKIRVHVYGDRKPKRFHRSFWNAVTDLELLARLNLMKESSRENLR